MADSTYKEDALLAFANKADTLERLRHLLTRSIILPMVRFSTDQWRQSADTCLEQIQDAFSDPPLPLIIRSAAFAEDTTAATNAGTFQSVANVPSNVPAQLQKAIQQVIDSYSSFRSARNQVFVQPMLQDVLMSGVVFTRDMDTLAPYYVINYDDHSHRTDTVTSGQSNDLKVFCIFKEYEPSNLKFVPLVLAIKEIERALNCDHLDIEYAINAAGEVFIFQVRPIPIGNRSLPPTKSIEHSLRKIYKKIEKLNRPHPYLYGKNTLLGVMPDWNPAEMIGIKPHPLALSLYRELITNRTWAYQRDNYGYKNLRSYPLIATLIGHPYVDVRVSFNSFIPKDIPEDLSARLCDYYISQLQQKPSSHDKVEFDILFSCFFLTVDQRLQVLSEHGFSHSEIETIKKSLLKLTNKIISNDPHTVFRKDLMKIEELKRRQEKLLHSSLTPLEKIYWFIEDCNRWGTLPFAGLARAGFIAVQMLNSFVEAGLLHSEQLEAFMSSLNTIAKQMGQDQKSLNRHEFLGKYGHLRPGTYDVLSKRYDEAYDLYFGEDCKTTRASRPFLFHKSFLQSIDKRLKTEKLCVDAKQLLNFIRCAIEGREYAKFVFTRSVSEVLQLVRSLASQYDISPEDASFIDIHALLRLYAVLDHRDLEEIIRDEISRNKQFYEITKLLRLPPLIKKARDVYEFELEAGTPNFVTLGRVQGPVLAVAEILSQTLRNKIVFIPSADPGYDWIFTKDIAGLITAYGGANSHMAIRAAELKIPAVIGAGEKNYQSWSKASIIEIDSENKQVTVIK
jgi:glutamine kinase